MGVTMNQPTGNDKIQFEKASYLAARIAKNDIEKTWGGTAYTRVTKLRDGASWGGTAYTRVTKQGDGPTGMEALQGVQVALVKQRHHDWEVTIFHPWFTDMGEYMSSSGSGIGTGFASEADAVAVARAVIKANWN
jgi:hypothetical protein